MRLSLWSWPVTVLALVSTVGCGGVESNDDDTGDGDADTDGDTDTDADTDGDTDGDTDADTDGDTDADTDGDTDADTDADGDTDADADADLCPVQALGCGDPVLRDDLGILCEEITPCRANADCAVVQADACCGMAAIAVRAGRADDVAARFQGCADPDTPCPGCLAREAQAVCEAEVCVVAPVDQCDPGRVTDYRLQFEADYLDLDTGAVHDCMMLPCLEGPDLHVAYNANRVPHSVIFQDWPAEIAHLPDRTFEDVTNCDVAGAPFQQQLIDEPFDDTFVILIRTNLGAVYKLGNPVEDGESLTFDSALLP